MSDMKRSERIHSKHAGREVLCARWGHFGAPVLLFPTAGGDGEECERMKMIHVLRPLLEAGRIKVYSCDSIGGQALVDKARTAESYAAAQAAFDRFVADELVPWIRADCQSPDIEIITAGASIGAFNAVAAVCKHPDLFHIGIGMSGTYDVSKWLEPPFTLDFYLSSPMHFLPRLADGEQLARLRKRLILLPTGSGPYEDPLESVRMAGVLGAKGVPNRYDNWGKEYRHDWTTWRAMLPKYLSDLVD